MTTRITVVDPGPAARTAKNAPTGPGLTRQSHNHSERNTMVEANAAAPKLPKEAHVAPDEDPACAYWVLSSAVRNHLNGHRAPGWLQAVVSELDTAMTETDAVAYTPQQINALIATVAAREVAGRLRERADHHWKMAAALAADPIGDPVEECQAAWHRLEATDLDALAARELAGGGVR